MATVLGISAYYHDSAAALLRDGKIVAAAQEERFSRKKFDADFPRRSIQFCLNFGGVKLCQVDAIVFYDKPFTKFDRIMETWLEFAPKGFTNFRKSMPVWIKEKLFLKSLLLDEFSALDESVPREKIRNALKFSEHHLSHAASAFYPSPFEKALVLVLDGVGEWVTSSVFLGDKNQLRRAKEIRFPHSLGLLYSAFTEYCGFKVNSGEYKLMGLAPYGKPRFSDLIRQEVVRVFDDGSFSLRLDLFDYCTGMRMTGKKLHRLLGQGPRDPDAPVTEFHMDVAASIQQVTEEILLKMVEKLRKEFPDYPNLCLAGGVALNCVANGKILRKKLFNQIWIQPAAGDAGGALGAALAYHYSMENRQPSGDQMQGAFLGSQYSNEEIRRQIQEFGLVSREGKQEQNLAACANLLNEGQVLGLFQGRMEFGPRALGARSIIADARNQSMQMDLNLKIKFREGFRPFAPAVTQEKVGEWFDLNVESPYMLLVDQIRADRLISESSEESKLRGFEKLKARRSQIPAVTHVDGSARIQTIDGTVNPVFYSLLQEFEKVSGCPVLVNTSFNVRSEPIVESPTDAFRCFMGTDIDALWIGDFLLLKKDQPAHLLKKYHHRFEKD
ncbi:MAG: carbamoyltransferase [Bdellovibrionales bacterium]|nr:carbamoyltransferase [Bdellovibrionales bacterium]